ncbi:uncharacterized protein A1O9_02738 [Exophiala aquamarina CBS 119918]|uniref:Uncharacterized protein n=1 Tax=Exophiala aquamarina CBS 119918 TaxID=1182545 RepID=A0A072PPA3_9EURO|nr:uncharacterized protein A1O9_02738 [Exophiala aquamarina CBS 119918]KEF61173.1 hypothetical protein A1O9_02738 [Exophiala aquamarina CBS 119918]
MSPLSPRNEQEPTTLASKLTSKKPVAKPEMAPIAWVFIAIFSAVLVIIALVHLYGLRLKYEKKRTQRKAENESIFGATMTNPITARKSFENHQHA